MFFDDWEGPLRVVLVGVLAYAALVAMLRISGNRTLSKMNSFDLVVTVAFGSTLSTILVNHSVALVEGLVALALLVGLQFAITWVSVRSSLVNALVKTAPTLLLRDGRFLHRAMVRVRVTEDEVRTAIRQQGWGGIEQIAAVVLETDGSLSVIANEQAGSFDSLHGVCGMDAAREEMKNANSVSASRLGRSADSAARR